MNKEEKDLTDNNKKVSTKSTKSNKKRKYIWLALIIIVVVIAASLAVILTKGEVLEKIGISSKSFLSGSIQYGDVNQDEKVTTEDALIVLKNITGIKDFTDEEKKIADVDGSGTIDQLDVKLILSKVVKLIDEFPIEGNKYGFAAGDVNQDGKITTTDALIVLQYTQDITQLTGYQKVLADVSGDSTVTKLDSELIEYYIVKKISTFPIYDSTLKYYSLGDVNEDDSITSEDALLVEQYIQDLTDLTEIQKLSADVNEDGTISNDDAEMILQVVVGTITIPEKGSSTITDDDTSSTTDSNTTTSDDDSTTTNNNSTNNNNSSNNNNSTNNNNSSNNNSTNNNSNSSNNSSTDSNTTTTTTVLYGDVDLDGKITSKDALLVNKYIKGLSTLTDAQKKNADVDGDGLIDALDSELILKYIAKEYTKLDPSVKYYTLGDVDGDGKVTSSDALIVQKASVKLVTLDEIQKRAADMNGDGVVSITDAQDILKIVVKLK